MQHIWDEVADSGALEYIRRSEIIKKYMPDIKIIEATSSQKIVDAIDVWVPLHSNLCKNLEFYKERQAAGEEVWHYTCCGPVGTWANRFLKNPLIHMRIQH
jgi:hypothetical protein